MKDLNNIQNVLQGEVNKHELLVRLPSNLFELNWLAREHKGLTLPLIVFGNPKEYGGLYYHPMQDEILLDDKYYPLDHGLIYIDDTDDDDKNIVNTIAHEFRHHWQFINSLLNDCIGWDLESKISYKEHIIKYFKKSKSEMDAFLYAEEKASCDITAEWKEWLLTGYVNLRT